MAKIESWWAWRDHLDHIQDPNIATLKREADCEIARILRCESRWEPKRPRGWCRGGSEWCGAKPRLVLEFRDVLRPDHVVTKSEAWASLQAPTLADLERLAEEAFARLPARFQGLCDGIVVRVEEFPDDETLREMGFDSPFDLLGLFRGIGLAQGGASPTTGQFPNMIWLYRRPILDYWAEHEETLGSLVTHVLVHEIGHHFGLSDADMEAIEAAADERRADTA